MHADSCTLETIFENNRLHLMTEEGCQNHAIVQYFTALLELTKTAFEKKNCYENDLEMSCLLKSEHQFWRSYDGLKLIVFTRK